MNIGSSFQHDFSQSNWTSSNRPTPYPPRKRPVKVDLAKNINPLFYPCCHCNQNIQLRIVVHIFPDQSRWMTRRRTKWWGRFFVKKKFGWSAASVCLKRVQTPVNSHCRRHHGCLCFVATCERLQLPRSCIDTSRRLRHHRVEDKVAEEVHQLPPSSPLWREREKWWSKVIQAIE